MLVAGVFSALPGIPASALVLDFRSPAWTGAGGAHAFAAGGVTATVDCTVASVCVIENRGRVTLWQDPTGGAGVRGGRENEEIDNQLQQLLTFSVPEFVRGTGPASDVFKVPDGEAHAAESEFSVAWIAASEPGTMLLLGSGLIGLGLVWRRYKRR